MKPSYGLTDEEVERMLLESFEHAEADFAARLLIEARNEAETVDHGDREVAARAGLRRDRAGRARRRASSKRIEPALAGLKTVLASADREAIQQRTQALNDATQHLAEVMMNRAVQAALAGKNVDRV